MSSAVDADARRILPPGVRISVVPNAVDLPQVTGPPGRREVSPPGCAYISGIPKSAPARMPVGQRLVTALSRV